MDSLMETKKNWGLKSISLEHQTILSARYTIGFALLTILISIMVIIGYVDQLMYLTSFGISNVPMAPSTAGIFILMGLGLMGHLYPQNQYSDIGFPQHWR